MKVIEFKPKEEPHLSGEAQCGACSHKWIATAPTGTTHLKCPECGRYWGVFTHAVEPAKGEPYWHCACGETLFFIIPDGALCRRCGRHPNLPKDSL